VRSLAQKGKGMSVNINLEVGKHGSQVPSGMKDMLEELMTLSGVDGDVRVQLGAQQKGTPARQGMRNINVRNVDGPVVVAVLQPGGNDTCREVRIFPPTGMAVDVLSQKVRTAVATLNSKEAPLDLLAEQRRLEGKLQEAQTLLSATEKQRTSFEEEARALDQRDQVLNEHQAQVEAERQRLREEYEASLRALEPTVAQIAVEKQAITRDRESLGQRRAPLDGKIFEQREAIELLQMEIDEVKEERKNKALAAAEDVLIVHGFTLQELAAALASKK